MTGGHEEYASAHASEPGHRPVRAPQEDRGLLIDPPARDVADLLRVNQARTVDYDVQGRSLAGLAAEARATLVQQATRYTRQYRDVQLPTTPNALLLAGHQPQLFHPGVWFKNFALSALAEQHNAVGVNLIIDSDTIKQNGLRVPSGSINRPTRVSVPYDAMSAPVPFEQRGINDRAVFRGFGRAVVEEMLGLVPDPLIEEYWPMAVARMEATGNLGLSLAQSRHMLEGRWGANTLEIPHSRVCDMEPDRWFFVHILAQLPRFRETYNRVVHEYRRTHRIRNRAHPVPDLAENDGWLEAPFWIWTEDDPRRRPLFARLEREQIRVSDRCGVELALPLGSDGSADRAVEYIGMQAKHGVRIRSRALITTLWARLVLGDLFLHGIGGGKYDQVTDALIAQFFGLTPPNFMILSATLQLPHSGTSVTAEDARELECGLRDLTFHPEVHMNEVVATPKREGESPTELATEKRRWIATEQTAVNARSRYLAFRRINAALQPWVETRRAMLLVELDSARQQLQAESVLAWREYGFCLHGTKNLREFLTDASQMLKNTF